MTGLSTKTRRQVADRDKGRCLRCGMRGTNIQHRIGRGAGGTSRPEVNGLAALVTLCGSGTTGCHGHITEHPTEAYETGWAIRRSFSGRACDVPLVDLYERTFYLSDSGDLTYLNDVPGLYPVNPSDYQPPWS